MTLRRQNLGKLGEDLACSELEGRGYAILDRRYRTRHGEIDIVARDGETMVFVEVRARVTEEFGTAAESVTRAKQRRLGRMAAEYLARQGLADIPCRFDVVAIDKAAAARPVITVFPHAFTL
jgi:putative endonuclease